MRLIIFLQPLICSEKMVHLWLLLQPVRHYGPGDSLDSLYFLAGATEQKQEVEWGTQFLPKKKHSPIQDNMRDSLNILKYILWVVEHFLAVLMTVFHHLMKTWHAVTVSGSYFCDFFHPDMSSHLFLVWCRTQALNYLFLSPPSLQ